MQAEAGCCMYLKPPKVEVTKRPKVDRNLTLPIASSTIAEF